MRTGIAFLIVLAGLCTLAGSCALAEGVELKFDMTYKQGDGFVDVMKGDKMVARYVYKDTPKPYVYPLYAPNGEALTRNFPMKEVAGEPTDHPHQRSMWVGHGNVNGVDFWTEGEKSGKIVQTSIAFDSQNPGYWNIHTTSDWVGPDGKKICEEDRRYTFLSCGYGTLVSTAVVLTASVSEVKLGDTKEGFFGVRVTPQLQLLGGKGQMLNSEGLKDADCWGKRAKWLDCSGEVNGKMCGITIFDAGANYNYPTYWHARDYGLLAADPFGGKDFTGDEKNDSSFTIPFRKSIRLLYIVLLREGNLGADRISFIANQIAGRGVVPRTTKPGGPAPSLDAPMPVVR